MKRPMLLLIISVWLISCEENSTAPNNDGGVDGDAISDVQSDADGGVVSCEEHVFENISILMADGAELSAFVRRAADDRCALPTILIQTPYDKENARAIWFDTLTPGPLFESRNYNFVVLDWRGFFGSADQAANDLRPHQGYDGYDAVEWIAAQPWSNGRVGTWGISALCVVQYLTAQMKPPHLGAMVPIFCSMNNTYEQYYPGGVLRREYMQFLAAYYGQNPQTYEAHPYNDMVWNYLGTLYPYSNVEVPALVVAGWYDLYNAGSIQDFHGLSSFGASAAKEEHRLLVGPWIHNAMGGETSMGRPLNEQELKYVDSSQVAQERSLAFFDFHLRGLGTLPSEPVEYRPDGADMYQTSSVWPPSGTAVKSFYLSDGQLTDASGTGTSAQFLYDPDDPSPTIGGQTLMGTYEHGPAYQDAVLSRADNVVYVSAPLDEALTLAGPVLVKLRVATTGLDTDLAVRLTVVDSGGRHLLIGEGIRRMKLRDGYQAPVAVVPDTPYDVEVSLVNHHGFVFQPGDRLGLIITSSNYARFDRNPNTGEDFYTDATVPQVVTNTVYHTQESVVELTILP